MPSDEVVRYVKAQAPVNIAVIKYWGKLDVDLKIPYNDSLSGTLSMDDLCTTTSVYLSESYEHDELILNGDEQVLSSKSPVIKLLHAIRASLQSSTGSKDVVSNKLLKCKAHIVSVNNFPTAAGLASSAAGYACLAYALGHAYGIKDPTTLSRMARLGSGSACRSLFGGFVHWVQGGDHESSVAYQVVDHKHWPDMRVVICVIHDDKKDVSSSSGMAMSVQTSDLMNVRGREIVPTRIESMKKAILNKDFETFANLTMQDSNQFHAICLDTFPPIFYLNETSKRIIKICHVINSFYGRNVVAYTFDAGPNACIYLLKNQVPNLIEIINYFFPPLDGSRLPVKGQQDVKSSNSEEVQSIIKSIEEVNFGKFSNSIKYLINTTIGEGPRLLESSCSIENSG